MVCVFRVVSATGVVAGNCRAPNEFCARRAYKVFGGGGG